MQGESTKSPRLSWYSRLRKLLKAEAASRDDLRELLRHGRWREVLDKNELAMLQGVLQVSQMQVRDVMVPRSHMVVLEHDAPMAELLRVCIDAAAKPIRLSPKSRASRRTFIDGIFDCRRAMRGEAAK